MDFAARIPGLSPTLQRVAHFIEQNRFEAMTKTAAEIGAATGTSDATVVRAVQALGFGGLTALRRALREELGHRGAPADNFTRTIVDLADGAESAVDAVLNIHTETLAGLRSGAARTQLSSAVGALARAGRIGVFGLGPSGYLAEYAALGLSRSGREALPLTAGGKGLADQLLMLRSGDAVLMLAYDRASPEAGATLAEARRLDLPVVILTDSLDERLSRHAEVVVPVLRGRAGQVALHGATLVCLEAIILGLSAMDAGRSVAGLTRLDALRRSVAGGWSSALSMESGPPSGADEDTR